jgi:hypothetical protein
MLTPAERSKLTCEYKEVSQRQNKLEHQLETTFLPPLRELLAAGQLDEARALFREIPESVTQVFALDAFRQFKVKVSP